MTSIRTRNATLADLDDVALLFDAYRQFYEQPSDLALAKDFIRDRMQGNESVIVLALDQTRRIVGFCQLYPLFCSIEAKPIYLLSDLYVAQDARRSGAGRALLQAAEQYAALHGRVKMELTTARTNKTAQAAYEAMGWVRDEVFHGYNKRVPNNRACDPVAAT